MSRRFRLATLRRLREHAAQEATAELGRAQRVLSAAEVELASVQQALVDCLPPARATPAQVQVAAAHRDALRAHAEEAATQVSTGHAGLAAATEHWHRRRAELRVVENLHARHRLLLAETDARREQRTTDDLAGTRRRQPTRTGPTDHHPGGEAA